MKLWAEGIPYWKVWAGGIQYVKRWAGGNTILEGMGTRGGTIFEWVSRREVQYLKA